MIPPRPERLRSLRPCPRGQGTICDSKHSQDVRRFKGRYQVRPGGYFAVESFDSIATASCTVDMNWAGKMMVEFFSIEISAIV